MPRITKAQRLFAMRATADVICGAAERLAEAASSLSGRAQDVGTLVRYGHAADADLALGYITHEEIIAMHKLLSEISEALPYLRSTP